VDYACWQRRCADLQRQIVVTVERAMITSRFAAAIIATAAVGLSFSSIVQSDRAVAETTEIKVLSAVAMKSALDDLAAEFQRTTGNKLTLAYAPAGGIRDRIQGGESFDLAILPRPTMDRLARHLLRLVLILKEILTALPHIGFQWDTLRSPFDRSPFRRRLTAKYTRRSNIARGGSRSVKFISLTVMRFAEPNNV
jgi:hypothetical protein